MIKGDVAVRDLMNSREIVTRELGRSIHRITRNIKEQGKLVEFYTNRYFAVCDTDDKKSRFWELYDKECFGKCIAIIKREYA